ncbi:MAG: ribosomal protein S12 methylthiotransferase accessory factor [Arcobacteraceae bacterium]|jgi:ribosomal protein S12 methylthiotransferase accessory factor
MNILSKNAPLEESISKMKAVLADVGCKTTFSNEKHPLQNCYSVNVASVEAPNHIYANGKGIVSAASMASALGEYIERVQTNNCFIDFYLPNRKYYPDEKAFTFDEPFLAEELKSVYDPEGELSMAEYIDYNSDYTNKIVSLPFINNTTKETAYIPINILSNLYVSNGLATGNTAHEAQVQGLSEIFERHAKIEIIKEGYALPVFPTEVIESFDKLNSDVKALRDIGFIVEILDASLGGKFPVTAISLINPKTSTLFVSFGAHPILQVSLERTMTELMQGRGLENLDAFEIPTFDMSMVSDNYNLESHFIDSNGKLGFNFLNTKKSFEYTSWDYNGVNSSDEHTFLINILDDMDKTLYIREYNYLDFYSCQMIVPTISEVYPVEDMLYNNKNYGKLIRNNVLNFKEHDLEDTISRIEALENTINVEKYIGVIFENNFTMLDFKTQIYLLLGDMEMALDSLELGTNEIGIVIAELIRMNNANVVWEDYEEALHNIFTEEKVTKAVNIINGEDYLIDVTLHTNYNNILNMYDRLELKKAKIL